MNENNFLFTVKWTRPALRKLLSFGNVDHDDVIRQSMYLLEEDPIEKADKVAHYKDYKYNDSLLKMIRGVIVVYEINNHKNSVRIKACHHGGTGIVAQIYYGIEPPFTNY